MEPEKTSSVRAAIQPSALRAALVPHRPVFRNPWVFMSAALVGAAGFITITGRERTSLSVDALAITAWVILGLIVAPIIGLALPSGAAIACYGILLLLILVYVLRFGRWETAFLSTVSWPVTWSLLALLFALSAHQFVFYP
ncbi:MAG: hypothetical protein ACXVSX_18220 [Solirubrobacteraceae bacterium]